MAKKKNEVIIKPLSPRDDLDVVNAEDYGVYERFWDAVTKNKGIRNIAVTGNFGIGKTSMLRTYEKLHGKHYLHISLGSFQEEPELLERAEKPEELRPLKRTEKPAEPTAQEASEKSAKEPKVQEVSEKSAEEPKAQEASEKSAEEPKAREASEKSAEEPEAQEASEKSAEELEAQEASEKSAEELKEPEPEELEESEGIEKSEKQFGKKKKAKKQTEEKQESKKPAEKKQELEQESKKPAEKKQELELEFELLRQITARCRKKDIPFSTAELVAENCKLRKFFDVLLVTVTIMCACIFAFREPFCTMLAALAPYFETVRKAIRQHSGLWVSILPLIWVAVMVLLCMLFVYKDTGQVLATIKTSLWTIEGVFVGSMIYFCTMFWLNNALVASVFWCSSIVIVILVAIGGFFIALRWHAEKLEQLKKYIWLPLGVSAGILLCGLLNQLSDTSGEIGSWAKQFLKETIERDRGFWFGCFLTIVLLLGGLLFLAYSGSERVLEKIERCLCLFLGFVVGMEVLYLLFANFSLTVEEAQVLGVNGALLLLGLCLCVLLFKAISELYNRLEMKKLAVTFSAAEFEIGKNGIGWLDKYGFELIYVLESVAKRCNHVVVFDDMDRLNYQTAIRICTKLRDINLTLSDRGSRMQFVYVINDEMLSEIHEHRKFFDYILPVYPLFGLQNMEDKWRIGTLQALKLSNKDSSLLHEFFDAAKNEKVSELADYRVHQDVKNEYRLLQQLEAQRGGNVPKTADKEEQRLLFVLYKVLFPLDYYRLRKGESVLLISEEEEAEALIREYERRDQGTNKYKLLRYLRKDKKNCELGKIAMLYSGEALHWNYEQAYKNWKNYKKSVGQKPEPEEQIDLELYQIEYMVYGILCEKSECVDKIKRYVNALDAKPVNLSPVQQKKLNRIKRLVKEKQEVYNIIEQYNRIRREENGRTT